MLTVENRRLPFELAFCSSELGKDNECFLVKAGARSAVCHHCGSRHEVLGLIEAIEERAIALGGDDSSWPIIMPEKLIGVMFRGVQRGRRAKKATSTGANLGTRSRAS